MNKIYNIVYSEERGTWVVCSELERASRKKSSNNSAAKLLARLDATQQCAEFADMLANLQKNYVSQQARLEKFSVARIKQD